MCEPVSATAASLATASAAAEVGGVAAGGLAAGAGAAAAASLPAWVMPVAMGLSAATSLGGAYMSSQAQSKAAQATQNANFATSQAQNQAFNERIAAAGRQTDAQTAVMQQTIADRNANTAQMRSAQSGAQQSQQDIINAENQQAQALRGTGDAQAKLLLGQTDADALAQSQADREAQAALLLDQSTAPAGPATSDPTEGGTATKAALSRRLAEAATNVRTYGSKVAALGAYDQPIQDINLAVANNQTGIMPAVTADKLLRAGHGTRLLPSQVAYRNAGDLGSAMDAVLSSRGQSGMDSAALSYGNDTGLASLIQGNATTMAANKSSQAQADAKTQQAMGGVISGIGNLGLYGAGYYGGGPSWLTPGAKVG